MSIEFKIYLRVIALSHTAQAKQRKLKTNGKNQPEKEKNMGLLNNFNEKFGFKNSKDTLQNLKMCNTFSYVPFCSESVLKLIQSSLTLDLNPFNGEIYIVMNDKFGFEERVGMKGWLKIANREPSYGGVEFTYCDDQEVSCFSDIEGKNCFSPQWIEASVYVKGFERPFTTREYFSDCFSPNSLAWAQSPRRRLRQTAFAQAVQMAYEGKNISVSNDILTKEEISAFDKLMVDSGITVVDSDNNNSNSGVVDIINQGSRKDSPIVEAEAEPEVETEAETEVEAEVEPEVEAEAETEVEAEVEPEVEPEVEAEAETEVEAEVEPEVETEVEAEAEPEVEAEAEPEVEAEVEPEVTTIETKGTLEITLGGVKELMSQLIDDGDVEEQDIFSYIDVFLSGELDKEMAIGYINNISGIDQKFMIQKLFLANILTENDIENEITIQ